jgi:hypothetical protein
MSAFLRKTLFGLSSRLPCRIISDAGVPYLERYGLFRAFGLRCYLHRFVGDDPARGLHDHPWPWAVAFVISGRYFEERRGMNDAPDVRIVRWFNFLVGDNFHRVLLPWDRKDVWTIFVHRDANVKRWGFLSPGGELKVTEKFDVAQYAAEGGMASVSRWESRFPKGRDEPRRMPL